jgi:uncharacterized protein (TIGR03083 family)
VLTFTMASHAHRLEAARAAISYICSRNAKDMAVTVPHCPGWTVYNAAVHVGRVGVAWHAMIEATPDDPDSRTRGYADAEARGSGHSPDVLASWALAAIDALDTDPERPCYFSMTGGSGTVGLWGWHAASELAVHRLDIEQALNTPHSMSHEDASDAIDYACRYFLPAMARVASPDLAPIDVVTREDNHVIHTASVRAPGSTASPAATLQGAPIDLLLALWGRPHGPIDITGSNDVVDAWHALPSAAFQFGTWD